MKEQKKTKIICTIGPASNTPDVFRKLVQAGLNIARLNFSHGTHETHLGLIKMIRSVEKELNTAIAIMLDTKGPEVRTIDFENGSCTYEKGSVFFITSAIVLGNKEGFSVNYPSFFECTKIGSLVKIDDGKFVAKIIKKDSEKQLVFCKALNTYTISNHKGVNLPGARLNMEFLSKQDESDIRFGLDNGIDMIAASFVRRKEDVLAIKRILTETKHDDVLVISKIESMESLPHIDEIIAVSDGIMVARGDLGVEVEAERVPIIQKMLIDKCKKASKPVIVATQMLESMQHSIRPTRAEVNDVALAIYQEADCVMLSGESASGEYPVESTDMQRKIALEIEKELDYKQNAIEALSTTSVKKDSLTAAVSFAAITSAAKLIIVFDEDGTITKKISVSRPIVPIVCLTSSISVARKSALYWGIIPILLEHINQAENDSKFVFVNRIARNYKLKSKSKVLLVKRKNQKDFSLKEESIRIITIE